MPKYPKPKILAIDTDGPCSEALRKAGYNVTDGSFGIPYRVPESGDLFPVSLESASAPNCDEQEIVIASTFARSIADAVPARRPGPGVVGWWQRGTAGYINPRPIAMAQYKQSFATIRSHGAIFIVELGDDFSIQYFLKEAYTTPMEQPEYRLSSWGLLDELCHIVSDGVQGDEINFDSPVPELSALLKRGSEGASYRCTIRPALKQHSQGWIPLASNKFGSTVAALLILDAPPRYLLMHPRMPAMDKIIVELLENWCALWNPAFFPHLEGQKWVHRPEYEIPKVRLLQSEISVIKSAADAKVTELNGQIERLRNECADSYTLLRGTGDELVQAIITALKRLGFKDVVDMDAEAESRGEGNNKREDIQVRDQKPLLVIDVKGISGCPNDTESLQAEKHAFMRIRELKTPDVKGLTIVNHQKHIPPQDRDQRAFRVEIIENALQTGLGLMTTWDLFKLLRNVESLNWPVEEVKPIF